MPHSDSLCGLLAGAPAQQRALTTAQGTLTYGQLRAELALAAQLFAQAGVKRGDRVAMLCLNEPEVLVNLFALNAIGAVLLPLNFRLAPQEWRACVEDAASGLVIASAPFREQIESALEGGLEGAAPDTAPVQVIALEQWRTAIRQAEADPKRHVFEDLLKHPPEDALALLVYTSGTTGKPKGVMHFSSGLIANARASWQAHQMHPGDCVLSVLPLFHVGGLCIQTLPALLLGAEVILHARFDPEHWLHDVSRLRPSLTLLVPAVMQALLGHPRWHSTDLSSLRLCMAGSSIVPLELIRGFHERDLSCGQVYGSTESGPVTIVLDKQHAHSHEGAAGWPALATEIRLAPVQSRPSGNDGVGEILVRAPNVARGYWQKPDDPTFAQGWFHTGDLARQNADGSYRVVGRSKDMIISGGENIYPAELELLVSSYPEVLECAALGMPDAHWGEVLVLCLVLRPGCELDQELLQSRLSGVLARFKWPKRIIHLPQLPKTALGKVQKAALSAELNQHYQLENGQR